MQFLFSNLIGIDDKYNCSPNGKIKITILMLKQDALCSIVYL